MRTEYGEIINKSIIPKGDYAIYDFWNVYSIQKILDRNRGKSTKKIISEYERK